MTQIATNYTEAADAYFAQRGWQELPSPSRKYRKIDAKLPFGMYYWVAADRMRVGRSVTDSRAVNEPWQALTVGEYYSPGL